MWGDDVGKERVLLPITFVMLLVGILRHYAMQLLHTDPKPLGLHQLREQRALMRAACFRNNCHVLSPSRFEQRRNQLIQAFSDGEYLSDAALASKKLSDGTQKNENKDTPSGPPNPLDPAQMDGMMDGMKKQMVMMIPQTVVS